MSEKRRIAILIEIPNDQHGMSALRLFLKGLLRSFGIRCLSIREPCETVTFKDESPQHEPKQRTSEPP